MRVLIVEDDEDTARYLSDGLRESGHVCDMEHTGPDGLAAALGTEYDVIIMDRMLPRLDGLSVVRTLRAEGHSVPVLILSALSQVDDRVKGLRAGGDDYLTKPFAFSELLARIDALTRRGQADDAADTTLRVGDLELDMLSRSASRGGRQIELQQREFMILEYLMRRAGGVGLQFRSPDKRDRRAYQPAAAEDRQRLRRAASADDPRGGIHAEGT